MDFANTGHGMGPGEDADPPRPEAQSTKLLMLGALGVVYGDIGTSPIYAFREALHAAEGPVSRADVLGVLSLIVWALTIIVTIKYVAFVLRADNKGEGGTLSLMSLARSAYPKGARIILAIGLCGAALFFGDSIITPAISVLSAVEGLEVITPALDAYVIPITLVILAILFSVQRFGTGKVAAVFGPVTAVWFIALGIAGLSHLIDDPSVLLAINPYYAVAYLAGEPSAVFVTVGAVFLAVTGAEALYVDLGHFGRRPIVLRLVLDCVSMPPAELFRARRIRAGQWREPAQSVLPDAARMGADADGRIGNGCYRDRQPGGDFGRLFADQTGGAAQSFAQN